MKTKEQKPDPKITVVDGANNEAILRLLDKAERDPAQGAKAKPSHGPQVRSEQAEEQVRAETPAQDPAQGAKTKPSHGPQVRSEQAEEQVRAETPAQDPAQGAKTKPSHGPQVRSEQAEEQVRAETPAQDPAQGAKAKPSDGPQVRSEQAEEQVRAETPAQDPAQGAKTKPSHGPQVRSEQAEEQVRAETPAQDPAQGAKTKPSDDELVNNLLKAIDAFRKTTKKLKKHYPQLRQTLNDRLQDDQDFDNAINDAIKDFDRKRKQKRAVVKNSLKRFHTMILRAIDSKPIRKAHAEAQQAYLELLDAYWGPFDDGLNDRFTAFHNSILIVFEGLNAVASDQADKFSAKLDERLSAIFAQRERKARWEARFSWLTPLGLVALGVLIAELAGAGVYFFMYWNQ